MRTNLLFRAALILWLLWFQGLPLLAQETCGSATARLGSSLLPEAQKVRFALYSRHAERIELLLYSNPLAPEPMASYVLHREPGEGVWSAEIPLAELQAKGLLEGIPGRDPGARPLYYGYRLWGPNWKYDPEWRPGSTKGFVADVDAQGNRFNPNKLVVDPWALEVSHDPRSAAHGTDAPYLSGPEYRHLDSGPVAPKGIFVVDPRGSTSDGPVRSLKDEIIYEMHVRGFTKADPSVPEEEAGTYRGLIRKIPYLKKLGVTAVELMPIHQFQNETNSEIPNPENNYWGYMTNQFMAADPSYATAASRRIPGGTIAEFREMANALHEAGIKLYLDVVFNHTGESGAGGESGQYAKLLSFRAIDNQTYYQLSDDPRFYKDSTGCGANFNCAHPHVRDFIMNSLQYWRNLGVDGFRFDLAPVLGNAVERGNGFRFDPVDGENVLNRAIVELPARPTEGGKGVDLIAEPWAPDAGGYQLGAFPHHREKDTGWAEWNGRFRDTVRKTLNAHGHGNPTPGELATRIAGSDDIFGHNGRRPPHTVNFVTAHDGFTLADLFRYNKKQNDQPPPFGPSPGGDDHNISWDQAQPGDNPGLRAARQRQAARNAMALNLLSRGVPMIAAGDEFLRSQGGNNNMYNVDNHASWVNWNDLSTNRAFFDFTRRMISFRKAHASLRGPDYFNGQDRNGNGLRDIAWLQASGKSAEDRDLPPAERGYMDNPANAFLAFRIDAEQAGQTNARSLYVAYNGAPEGTWIRVPPPESGRQWYWAGDTHMRFEGEGNFREVGREVPLGDVFRPAPEGDYYVEARSLVVLIER